jgi:integrase
MATLTNSNGRLIVQVFVGEKRQTIYLGKIREREGRVIKAHIEYLANAILTKLPVPLETAGWLSGLSDELHAKLAKAGLVQSRESACIGDYFAKYIKRRSDLKPRTIKNLYQAKHSVVKFFGPLRDMRTITRGEAKDWQREESRDKAAATVAMYVKKVRQVFADAIDRKLLNENPFKAIKAGQMVNEDRMVYIPPADIETVIDTCPNTEWKLLFALARFAGLRVPSETHALLWSDILWGDDKMRVRASKTEHHRDKGIRLVPIFPEVGPLLAALLSEAEPGAKHVFSKLRGENLATTGAKIIERAGLTPWPKTWQNLRSSCETDLAMTFPLHVACRWIGNSEIVARKHYLQVTEDHYRMAVENRAAFGAAVRCGQLRTSTGHPNQKTPENPRFSAAGTTPKGSRSNPEIQAEYLQKAHRVLQSALHGLRRHASEARKSDIQLLGDSVRASSPRPASQGKGGGR